LLPPDHPPSPGGARRIGGVRADRFVAVFRLRRRSRRSDPQNRPVRRLIEIVIDRGAMWSARCADTARVASTAARAVSLLWR